jgi:transcriptional regulator with XRE-family HTH domain
VASPTVANLIVRACKRLKITDAELARRVGVTRSTVHGWVHGNHEPTLESLRGIADALECDIGELLGVS